jgi:hypothetical protein
MVRLGFVYLLVVAVLAAVVAVVGWPAAVIVTWLIPACFLFGAYLHVGSERDMFRETASAVVGLLVAVVATAIFAFLGLVVAINIWLIRGEGI